MSVFVLDKNKKPLMPCHPARARDLLAKGKAAVFRRAPFTIILIKRANGICQDLILKFDPGSKTTGVALVANFECSDCVIWAAHLKHRGAAIKKTLDQRRALRRGRRSRHTRYRASRFENRTRPSGWLPPSIQSRVDQVARLGLRLSLIAPVTSVAVETVRFDMQKLKNPEISGAAYQQGTLFGYEVREYLLEKWGRKCAYCEKTDIRLEIDHIVPKSSGGTNAVGNLTICCRNCNEKKGNKALQDFLKQPVKVAQILSSSKRTLKDAAAVNASRLAIGEALSVLGKPISYWSGGQTKHNRQKQGFPKEHWLDAACVGDFVSLTIPQEISVLEMTAKGRGSRQKCLVDRFGFPRSAPKAQKRVFGFQTGDLVSATVPSGKKQGHYRGCVAVRATGNFNIQTPCGVIQGIHAKHCVLTQRMDGYSYIHLKEERHFLPGLKAGVSVPSRG
ncbi:MAG: endonuclease [Parachlamydiales bacterium]|nr:endonuclease [Parachlamydiales bacterium]